MKCELLSCPKLNCRSVAVSPSCSPATRLGKVTSTKDRPYQWQRLREEKRGWDLSLGTTSRRSKSRKRASSRSSSDRSLSSFDKAVLGCFAVLYLMQFPGASSSRISDNMQRKAFSGCSGKTGSSGREHVDSSESAMRPSHLKQCLESEFGGH